MSQHRQQKRGRLLKKRSLWKCRLCQKHCQTLCRNRRLMRDRCERDGRKEADRKARKEAQESKNEDQPGQAKETGEEKGESKAARELRKFSALMGGDDDEDVAPEEPSDPPPVTKSAAELLVEKWIEELQAVAAGGRGTRKDEVTLESFAPDSGESVESVVMTEPAKAEAQAEPNKRILIVDDIPVNQKLLRLQLKRLGFTSFTANNGEAALESMKGHDFALILMDLDMPVMDGFQLQLKFASSNRAQARMFPPLSL